MAQQLEDRMKNIHEGEGANSLVYLQQDEGSPQSLASTGGLESSSGAAPGSYRA